MMRQPIRWALGALLTTALSATLAQPDVGTPPGGQPIHILPTSTDKRVVATVYSGRYSWVRIETSESGSPPNQHPATVAPGELRTLLEQVQWVDENEALFSTKQLDEISAPLATALGRANAEQDVSFAVSDQFGFFGSLAQRAVTTARVFYREGQLQLIVGLARRNFESQFRATGLLIAFEPGQRAQPVDRYVKLSVPAGRGRVVRADWVALDVGGSAAARAPVGATVPSVPAPQAPTLSAPAVSAGATAASAVPSAGRGAEEIYRGVAERLRALDKLRSDGLITEAEYQEKRRQLLRDL